jgi:alanine racemase
MKRREFLGGMKAAGAAAALASIGGAASSSGRPSREKIEAPLAGSRDPRIRVDLAAIGRNLDRVRRRTKAPVMGVVKADAYGHGLVEVARFLESAGVAALMTGKLEEAAAKAGAGAGIDIHVDTGMNRAGVPAVP